MDAVPRRERLDPGHPATPDEGQPLPMIDRALGRIAYDAGKLNRHLIQLAHVATALNARSISRFRPFRQQLPSSQQNTKGLYEKFLIARDTALKGVFRSQIRNVPGHTFDFYRRGLRVNHFPDAEVFQDRPSRALMPPYHATNMMPEVSTTVSTASVKQESRCGDATRRTPIRATKPLKYKACTYPYGKKQLTFSTFSMPTFSENQVPRGTTFAEKLAGRSMPGPVPRLRRRRPGRRRRWERS